MTYTVRMYVCAVSALFQYTSFYHSVAPRVLTYDHLIPTLRSLRKHPNPMTDNSTIEVKEPDPPTNPEVFIKDWEEQVKDGEPKPETSTTESTKIWLTRLVFPRTHGAPEDKILTRINSLLSKAALKHTTCIIPLQKMKNNLPITGQLKDDNVLSKYYNYKIAPTQVVGLIKIQLPSTHSFTKWKRDNKNLLHHIQEEKIYWTTTNLQSLDTRFPLFLYNIPSTGIDLTALSSMIK